MLLIYIALAVFNHLVEGPLRDPASLNKPSTAAIAAANMVALFRVPMCSGDSSSASGRAVLAYVLLHYTMFGFASRLVGGNVRAARLVGLPVGALVLAACFLAGVPPA